MLTKRIRYKQTFGTFMGNPLPPFIANVFLNKLENSVKNSNVYPKVWYWYVDDILAIVSSAFDNFLEVLSKQYPSIGFAMDKRKEKGYHS